jgi:arabinan endo-1,5-alpha-L-arabinosidase
MKHNTGFFFFSWLAVMLIYTRCSAQNNSEEEDKTYYTNPISSYSLPDPTVIQSPNGSFYLYATEDLRNTPILKSSDLVNWQLTGRAFTNETRPTFEPKGGLWAPDINYINGKYVLYYSMSVWGGEQTCGIGIAVSENPEGLFTDQGKLFRSSEIGVQNSIDPFYIEENGKKFLFWGSFHGIYGIELSSDGLSVKPGATKKHIAGTAYEGTYIHKKDGYYFLFASVGSCCEGINSTYKTVVGRSVNLFGPYTDKAGKPMMENHHAVVIQGDDKFAGTGHNSEIITDKIGRSWIFYHAVDKSNPKGRKLMLDEVKWVDGWPTVENGVPSKKYNQPKF